jgi:predicted nucleic acid-binding protein
MRPIALDTNTYVGFKRGEAASVEVIRQAKRLLISSTVLGELLAGFACGDREARNREELRRFLAVDTVEVTPIGLQTADTYGLLYRSLRQQGTAIPSNDLWIAASCLEHGAVLFSLDVHFERVPGLRLVRCWAEVFAVSLRPQ